MGGPDASRLDIGERQTRSVLRIEVRDNTASFKGLQDERDGRKAKDGFRSIAARSSGSEME